MAVAAPALGAGGGVLTEPPPAFLGPGDLMTMGWGWTIGAGRGRLRTARYLAAIPSVAILFSVLAVDPIGEGLNGAFNPRLRNR